MDLSEKVRAEIDSLIDKIKLDQSDDGSWRYCFESGPMTDAYMIIILRTIECHDEELIKKLVNRLLIKQDVSGSWKLFDDDSGNLSVTVEAYTALLFSGYIEITDEKMKKAEAFIRQNGGLESVHVSTKFMLALHELYPWPSFFPVPLLLMNLPKFFPLSFFKFSSYVRFHFAPLLILGHKRFTIKNKWTPTIQHLFTNNKFKATNKKRKFSNFKMPFINSLSKVAIKKAEQYILQNIERDGTLSSYASATFIGIYALLSLGYQATSPVIQNAVLGIKSFLFELEDSLHIQNSPSTIWDTALTSYALQEAGVPINDKAIESASNYLVSLQHTLVEKDHKICLGGWGFSDSNTQNPDVDDTQAVLRATTDFSLIDDDYRKSWNAGVKWLFDMQNKDGGWASFEKNSSKYLKLIFPIQNFVDTAVDPSTADLTGRTIEFLGSKLKLNMVHPRIEDGVNWLIHHQHEDGSWYGRWGISYIYGTWAAITGMKSVGIPSSHPSIQKANNWLLNIKNKDGGWGESCKSDIERKYIPLSYSTIVHTSWVVDTLISINDYPTSEIDDGIANILNWLKVHDKRLTYPTGGGLPGHFYINYHSYRYIWPLLTLSHYLKKYETSD
ncbi:prenyltransferase/squalene oxidase repeat-containing protein [Bacillus sp. AFS088145]|uniref:terpene cyclase/mutase family protein n=1 Tax=Bacillus sp. AFS088145 TaxID=2033514 RepID=UPI000BF95BCC|nr:prenyltransferase/squalene oxidase repeat-containing protein [Bacillus sp. AFS088145]PFH82797.1 squalene--hopene cyclase [Bacillus sp. AFS088145]